MSAVAVNYRVACKRVEDLQFELKKAMAAKRVAAEALQREERNKEREKLKIIANFAKAKPTEKTKMKGKAPIAKAPIVKPVLCKPYEASRGRPVKEPGQCQQCLRRLLGKPGGHKHTCGKAMWARM